MTILELAESFALKDENNLILNTIMIIDIENKNTDWSKHVNNYMEMVNLNIIQIKTLSIIQIKNKINEWDRNQWY